MKIGRKLLTGGAALMGVVLLAGLLAPRAARGFAAALVDVANTRSNPVPSQDVDNPARHPYQVTCSTTNTLLGYANCSMPAVPANNEFVIQNISAQLTNAYAGGALDLQTTGGGTSATTFIPMTSLGTTYFVANTRVTQYADPGTQASCNIAVSGASGVFFCTMIGYLVSLP